MVPEKGHQRQKKSRRAVAALQRMPFPKTFLQGMKPLTLTETFDGCNFGTVSLNGKHQARSGRLSVKEDRTRAARAMFAPDMSPGEIELFSQKITKVLTDFDISMVILSINRN